MIEQTPPTQQLIASVVLVCGLPASGKSTLARTLIDLHKQHCCNKQTNGHEKSNNITCKDSHALPIVSRFDRILLINYDSIAQQEMLLLCNDKNNNSSNNELGSSLHPSFDSNELEAWRKSRGTALNTLKHSLATHFGAGDNASSLLVIMDDNFHLRSMRRDVYRTCQEILALPSINQQHAQPQISFATVYFSTPLEVCIERNNMRSGKEHIPVDVIHRLASAMEPPDETKAYASFERFHVSIDNADTTDMAINNKQILYEIDECIEKSLQSPILPKIESSQEEIELLELQRVQQREETSNCHIQRIDQLLRKLVGAVGRVDKKRTKEANDIRKSIMERIRKNNDMIDMSDDDSVAKQFACLMLGIEICDDWHDMDNPLVNCIKDALQQFQTERSNKVHSSINKS